MLTISGTYYSVFSPEIVLTEQKPVICSNHRRVSPETILVKIITKHDPISIVQGVHNLTNSYRLRVLNSSIFWPIPDSPIPIGL